MRTLCIDTSAATALALVEDGITLASARSDDPRRHAEEIGSGALEVVRAAGASSFADAGIGRVCVGTGPGPFTGLRAGIAFAKSLGKGLNVPVLGVWSQEAHALAGLKASEASVELVLSDARRSEVYWGIYRETEGGLEVVVPPSVGPLQDALHVAQGTGVKVVTGPEKVVAAIGNEFETFPALVQPELFAGLADGGGRTFSLEPLYLRRPDIQGVSPEPLPIPER